MRLGGASYYKNRMAEVKELFAPEDYMSDKPLTGEYLLGYYCQRQKLFEKMKDNLPTAEGDDSQENSEE